MSSQKREAKTSSKNLPSLKKCKCGSLKHQHITTLEDALTHINTITFEGAKLLDLYLLDKLDRETSEHAMVSTCGIGQIISLSANQYLTNCTGVNINNVGENVKNIDDASQRCLNYILELYNEVRDFVGDLDLSEDAMGGAKSWQNYLPLLYKILKIFEENNNIKGLRIFDIIPQFSFHTRYMSLDTNALYKVLKSIVIHPLERGINETQFGGNANYYWNQMIGLDPGRKDLFVAVDIKKELLIMGQWSTEIWLDLCKIRRK
nr:6370_t:CDS:2 [Entrophospora candida]